MLLWRGSKCCHRCRMLDSLMILHHKQYHNLQDSCKRTVVYLHSELSHSLHQSELYEMFVLQNDFSILRKIFWLKPLTEVCGWTDAIEDPKYKIKRNKKKFIFFSLSIDTMQAFLSLSYRIYLKKFKLIVAFSLVSKKQNWYSNI